MILPDAHLPEPGDERDTPSNPDDLRPAFEGFEDEDDYERAS